jgi:hypothetical protein
MASKTRKFFSFGLTCHQTEATPATHPRTIKPKTPFSQVDLVLPYEHLGAVALPRNLNKTQVVERTPRAMPTRRPAPIPCWCRPSFVSPAVMREVSANYHGRLERDREFTNLGGMEHGLHAQEVQLSDRQCKVHIEGIDEWFSCPKFFANQTMMGDHLLKQESAVWCNSAKTVNGSRKVGSFRGRSQF